MLFYKTRQFQIASFFLLFLFLSSNLQAQERHTISGNLSDATTGEALIGATVQVNDLGTGSITNVYGFYSITVPEGEYNLTFSYVGYQTQTQSINLSNSMRINLELQPQSTTLEEVVVQSERQDVNVQS